MPPSTTVSPSLMRTFEFASRLISFGMPSTERPWVKSGWLDLA